MDEDAEDIAAAVNDGSIANDLPDPLTGHEIDDLVAAAGTDPGAPFEANMMARIKATREMDRATFVRLRDRIKAARTVPMKEFDEALGNKASSKAATMQGRRVAFETIDPWPQDVDGDDLLTALVAEIKRHVIVENEAAIGVALWIMHAHCFMAFAHSARLVITSPMKRCGKTKLLRVVQMLVPKPLPAANITPSVMFRAIEKYRPTLLIDEADTFLPKNEELRGVINSGHERDGMVLRNVGDDHEPSSFSTFCPTAIAAIGGVPETIEDRALHIQLRRRLGRETIVQLRTDKAPHLVTLKRKIARWIAEHNDDFEDADPLMPPVLALNDRACDNWRALLAIVDVIGGQWPQQARDAASLLCQADADDDQARETKLLIDIRNLFASRTGPISSTTLTEDLIRLSDRPWATYRGGKPLTPHSLARLLGKFGIKPKTIKLPSGLQPHGYEIAQFADAFARYLSHPINSASQSSPSSPTHRNSTTYDEDGPSEIPGNPCITDEFQDIENIGPGELLEVFSIRTYASEELGEIFRGSQQEPCE